MLADGVNQAKLPPPPSIHFQQWILCECGLIIITAETSIDLRVLKGEREKIKIKYKKFPDLNSSPFSMLRTTLTSFDYQIHRRRGLSDSHLPAWLVSNFFSFLATSFSSVDWIPLFVSYRLSFFVLSLPLPRLLQQRPQCAPVLDLFWFLTLLIVVYD